MRLLALDTSTSVTVCALLEEEATIWCKRIEAPLKAGDVLPSALGDLTGVQGIAVGLGPGSFTGLRVGIACAKALSYALRIPIAGASSLRALALREEGLVCAATDARKGELFTQFFEDGAEKSQVRVVMQSALQLGQARFLKDAPSPIHLAKLCLPKLRAKGFDEAIFFSLAPDYQQVFENLT